MDIRFGTVWHARFKTEKGGTLRSVNSRFHAAQTVANHSATALNNTADAFATRTQHHGRTDYRFFFVENGPNDTDGSDFSREAVAINDKWVEKYRANGNKLSTEEREALAAEQLALSEKYAAKAQPQRIDIIIKADGSFEKGKITPLPAEKPHVCSHDHAAGGCGCCGKH